MKFYGAQIKLQNILERISLVILAHLKKEPKKDMKLLKLHQQTKGKECLTEFFPKYNETNGTAFKLINELNTDDLLLSLISFIEQQEPAGI